MAWAVAAEIYPGRYRSEAIALCSAANWLFNFLLAFFTPSITRDIGLPTDMSRRLQLGRGGHRLPILTRDKRQVVGRNRHYVPARGLTSKSSKWEPPRGEDLVTADKADAQQGRIANR